MSLGVNCWEINQITSKCQQISRIKLADKSSKQKKEHHHQTLHIPNSSGTKFQLKIKTLNFWKKLINIHHQILHI